MCHCKKTSNVKQKSRSSSAKRVSTATVVARKSRTKTRKPKYLSLKLQLSSKTQKPTTQKQQLNLFPLHPEKDHMQEHDQVNDDVTFLLDTDNSTTTTLHDLLDTTTATSEEDKEALLSTETATYYGGGNGLLEKAAMRNKERDASEERWVSYWEVVEEVSSCSGGTTAVEVEERRKLVGLKLDYEEILNAWCDKGPLYVEGESPQTVPDVHASSNALIEEWRSVGNLWQVPEIGSGTSKDEVGAKEGWKLGQREASVLRYKEKRQNRLFSKRIRYEVRKLNAEKRPRLKGRFVKRDADE